MKTLLCLLALAGSAWAQTNTNSSPIIISFTNTFGVYITNAEVVRWSSNKLIYRTENGAGGGTIRLSVLPPDLQAMFNYDTNLSAAQDSLDASIKNAQAQYWERQKEMVEQQALADEAAARRHAYGAQVAANADLTIRANAEKRWPDDYDMQIYEINKQVEAYNWLNSHDGSVGVPSDVFLRIKSSAENRWQNDYDMQRYEIQKQVDAYSQLH